MVEDDDGDPSPMLEYLERPNAPNGLDVRDSPDRLSARTFRLNGSPRWRSNLGDELALFPPPPPPSNLSYGSPKTLSRPPSLDPFSPKGGGSSRSSRYPPPPVPLVSRWFVWFLGKELGVGSPIFGSVVDAAEEEDGIGLGGVMGDQKGSDEGPDRIG